MSFKLNNDELYGTISKQGKTAIMMRSLPASTEARYLAKLLRSVDTVTKVQALDVTNCVVSDMDVLFEYIGMFSNLRFLRCLGCPVPATSLLSLLQERLVELEELEFSLIIPDDMIGNELEQIFSSSQEQPYTPAQSLRRMYVEVIGEENAVLLWWLLRFCPSVTELHVHVVSGSFQKIVFHINDILFSNHQLEAFTFTSDVPPTAELVPLEMTDFNARALVCANVSYWDFLYSCSCVWLCDFDLESTKQELSSQLVVIVTHEADVLADRIGAAVRGHDWTGVRYLCLVLLPQQPFAIEPSPVADISYVDGLREFFPALSYLVELNVNSFHFGPDVDLSQMLRDAQLVFLQALSTAPCGLHHPGALRRLAEVSRELVELDVRVEQRGTQLGCTICQLEFRLDPCDVAALQDDFPRSRRRFRRLTLSGVPSLASLRFLESCKVDELRLVDCGISSLDDFADIGDLLLRNANLRFLVLRDSALALGTTTELMDNVTRVRWLRYLCLLTEAPVSDEAAEEHVQQLVAQLPKLKYLHVHYRHIEHGTQQQVSWVRHTGPQTSGTLIPGGPCVLCSTATFIGLNKPLNRG